MLLFILGISLILFSNFQFTSNNPNVPMERWQRVLVENIESVS